MCYICWSLCWGWTQFVALYLNKLYLLLLLPWAGVRLNHSSCVYSLFLRHQNPTEGAGGGEDEHEGWKKRTKDTCLWFRELDHTAVRRWEWVTFLSPSIPSSLRPSTGGNLWMFCKGSVVFFSCPPESLWHRSPSSVCKNSAGCNLTLSNGMRFEFPLRDTGTSWETTTI